MLSYRDALRGAVDKLTANPTASVTVSTGDGSKSVTYTDRAKLQSELQRVMADIEAYKRSLNGGTITTSYVRWC